MLLAQHHDIFHALEKRDPDLVEKAMTLHLQEISESVQLIRQENATGLAKSNKKPSLTSEGFYVFQDPLTTMVGIAA